MGTHTISAASTPFQASIKQDDTPNTRYASPERPHACVDGYIFVGYLVESAHDLDGEVEEYTRYRCKRCRRSYEEGD